jgi:hypothetical protein
MPLSQVVEAREVVLCAPEKLFQCPNRGLQVAKEAGKRPASGLNRNLPHGEMVSPDVLAHKDTPALGGSRAQQGLTQDFLNVRR